MIKLHLTRSPMCLALIIHTIYFVLHCLRITDDFNLPSFRTLLSVIFYVCHCLYLLSLMPLLGAKCLSWL